MLLLKLLKLGYLHPEFKIPGLFLRLQNLKLTQVALVLLLQTSFLLILDFQYVLSLLLLPGDLSLRRLPRFQYLISRLFLLIGGLESFKLHLFLQGSHLVLALLSLLEGVVLKFVKLTYLGLRFLVRFFVLELVGGDLIFQLLDGLLLV